MKTRSFADLMVGVLAYMSLTSLVAMAAVEPRRPVPAPDRWKLPARRKSRRRVSEDACRHCRGSGACDACMPSTCRVCRGTGLQPRDTALVGRLNELWDGVS